MTPIIPPKKPPWAPPPMVAPATSTATPWRLTKPSYFVNTFFCSSSSFSMVQQQSYLYKSLGLRVTFELANILLTGYSSLGAKSARGCPPFLLLACPSLPPRTVDLGSEGQRRNPRALPGLALVHAMADSALIAHTLDPSDSESNSELTSPMSSPLAYVASPASDLWKT
eukprot:6721595-Pyramimonas_sp.AAC.1